MRLLDYWNSNPKLRKRLGKRLLLAYEITRQLVYRSDKKKLTTRIEIAKHMGASSTLSDVDAMVSYLISQGVISESPDKNLVLTESVNVSTVTSNNNRNISNKETGTYSTSLFSFQEQPSDTLTHGSPVNKVKMVVAPKVLSDVDEIARRERQELMQKILTYNKLKREERG